ncbi:GOLPH3/VPS74 family protein [Streptomyces swartbergensis]|uniref:GPP34 family phosphoprotein n=1 Tax=Streptomyces swartbergensis TaxID=487165 RepID=A0A243RG23_9ACTN|nr:GPP34 family phosphoprotein [Streptomyces swartbergensis]OUC93687.1 GPP34 family phosphoprotein [Streptomyces swartbergensis]
MPNGPLSLPARLCLLAWDPARPAGAGTAHLPGPVRAGALTELAWRGLLVDQDGIATPVDLDSRTGDAVLDGLLELVRESYPHSWRTWVTLRSRVTLDAVREQLVAEGCLRAEKKRVLGVFPSVEYALERVAVVEALREETRQVLRGPQPVAGISERDAALVTLAASAELLPGEDVRAHERRVRELAERAVASEPGLGEIVREIRTALAATATATALP